MFEERAYSGARNIPPWGLSAWTLAQRLGIDQHFQGWDIKHGGVILLCQHGFPSPREIAIPN